MTRWQAGVGLNDPYWIDISDIFKRLPAAGFPGPDALNARLPPTAVNHQGKPIRFVSSETIPGVQYEQHIYATGEVSTRKRNWHDLFNAMVWMGFPLIKSAMNAVHHASMAQSSIAGRGKQRDALTLFDECGVLVASQHAHDLKLLANRDWAAVFAGDPGQWSRRYRIFIIGHAMYEKLLNPYKSMTANALLLRVTEYEFSLPRPDMHALVDTSLARMLLHEKLFTCSADLSPLPLMGIPGWWVRGHQDDAFYADRQVFRPAPRSFVQAPVFSLL